MSGQVIIKPLSAALTRDTDFFSKMDPYCVVNVAGSRHQTSTCSGAGKHPTWVGQQFTCRASLNDLIRFEVWDRDTVSKNDLIGEGSFAVASAQYQNYVGQVPLTYKGKSSGTLMVEVQFIQDGNSQIPVGQPVPQYPQQPYPANPGYPYQMPPPAYQGQYPGQAPVPPYYPGYAPPPQQYPGGMPPYPPPGYPNQMPPPPPPPGPMPPPGAYGGPYGAQPGYGGYPPQKPAAAYPAQGGVGGTQIYGNVVIKAVPTCYICHGTGYQMKKGRNKPCKQCLLILGICKKCYGTGYNQKKGKPCKKCRKYF